MAYKFQVATANIYVYNKQGDIKDSSNIYGMFNLNDTFTAEKTGDQNDDHWYKITECASNPSMVGKYVYRVTLASGRNFDEIGQTADSTEAARDENGNPINYNADGTPVEDAEGVDSDGSDDKLEYTDDAFMTDYVAGMTKDQYMTKLMEGLDINDIRGVLGIPHQFLPITDARIDGSLEKSALGRVYSEKILRTIPLLLITPGMPTFMAGYSDEQKDLIANEFFGGDRGSLDFRNLTDSYSGKYYSLKYAYTEYFKYVNGMLRSAAVFLGIHKERVNGKELENYNWLYDSELPSTESEGEAETNKFGEHGIARFLGPYVGAIALYADAGTSVSDSFGNNTTQSQLSSSLNSLSDTGRELNFFIGNVGSVAGLSINSLSGLEDYTNNLPEVQAKIKELLGENSIMSNILTRGTTILAGGRLVFPEIWSDSSFGRSYSCSMRLVSPSGDKLSVYLNILVPIYHLLAMVLPRESLQQAYFSPFLLRCYFKGQFNVDMGIMTDLSISKGAEGEWTVDGIPTVAEIQFSIKDMYETMYMSRPDDGSIGLMSNIIELDYIANSCGINVNDQEVKRTFKLWSVLNFENNITDKIKNDFFGSIMQSFNQKLNNIFGVF